MQLCVINEFLMSHRTWLPLIKVARVRSLGKSRVDYLKHPPQAWVRTAPLPTHHAPKLHTWLLSWRASASLSIQPTKLVLSNSPSVNIATWALREHMYLITNVSARLCGCIACAHLSRTNCKHNSECSLEVFLPVVVFQSSDATGQSPILSISFSRGWESRCSMRPAGKMPQLQPWFQKSRGAVKLQYKQNAMICKSFSIYSTKIFKIHAHSEFNACSTFQKMLS